jgi:UDP-2,3-diacylglucosamine pyrophosphatase LpxH
VKAIVAFSDVHLGYDRADSDAFMEFVKSLESRDDLGDVVIVGDLVDLWRRDVIGLELELSRYVEELKILQKRAEVHYVSGNHDSHVEYLKNYEYPFEPQSSLELDRFGYTVKFLHGHQCDPLQHVLGPNTCEYLCWTLSDDIGQKKSWIWDILACRGEAKLSRGDFEAQIDALMSSPEDMRRIQKLGIFSEFVNCIKANLRVTGENEFIVFGHTHKPFLDVEDRVANTGCWLKEMSPTNTYFEFDGWPPRVIQFRGQPLKPTSISTLGF